MKSRPNAPMRSKQANRDHLERIRRDRGEWAGGYISIYDRDYGRWLIMRVGKPDVGLDYWPEGLKECVYGKPGKS